MLTLSIAKGAINALRKGNAREVLETLGVMPEELDLLQGAVTWTANQRLSVCRTIDSLIFGSMDIIGLPRFAVPAEYIAATIALCVHPVNYMVACRWVEGGTRARDLAQDSQTGQGPSAGEPVKAQQLFALVLMLQEDGEVASAQSAFNTKVNRAIDKEKQTGIMAAKKGGDN